MPLLLRRHLSEGGGGSSTPAPAGGAGGAGAPPAAAPPPAATGAAAPPAPAAASNRGEGGRFASKSNANGNASNSTADDATADSFIKEWFGEDQAASDVAPRDYSAEKPEAEKPAEGEGEKKPAEGENKPEGGANAAEMDALKQQLAVLEPFKEIIEHLKEKNLPDAEAVKAHLAQQTAEAQIQQDINQHAQRLHQQLQARVDADELTPEQAQAEFNRETQRYQQDKILSAKLADLEAKQLDFQINTAVAAHPEVQAAGKEAVGLIKVLHGATKADIPTVAKFVNDLVTGAQTRAVAAYAAKQTETAAKPVPVDSGNGGAPPAQQGAKGNWQSSWADILGIK